MTPKLGPFGGPNFGAANSAVFEPKSVLSSLLHAIPAHKRQAFSAERSISENHDLHRQLSCGRDQHERNGHNGGPSWRSQNCFCFAGLEMGSPADPITWASSWQCN